jgi:hypothetical protein
VFHLGVNRTEVFSGSFNMGGGGSNAILFSPHGSTAVTTTFGATGDAHNSRQITWLGGVTDIALPVALLPGLNTLRFSYEGSPQGLRDEGWGVKSLGITSQVPEPKAYALLIAGLVAVGYVARRRRA